MDIMLIILFFLGLILWMLNTKRTSTKIDQPMFPPPALPPTPGGTPNTYYADYPGDNCSEAEQADKKACQEKYNNCINMSLQGEASFPNCHTDFMTNCMPIIKKCQNNKLPYRN